MVSLGMEGDVSSHSSKGMVDSKKMTIQIETDYIDDRKTEGDFKDLKSRATKKGERSQENSRKKKGLQGRRKLTLCRSKAVRDSQEKVNAKICD